MIFENYTYKTKLKILALIFIMLLAAGYKRSFSQLIQLVKENHELTDKKTGLERTKGNIVELKETIVKIDRIIGKEVIDKEKIQQNIISFISERNSGVSIYDMQSIHKFEDENYFIYTNQLDLTGNFNNLLNISYQFEKKFLLSRLSGMRFYTNKKNSQQSVLHLKMIFQNYENNK